MTYTLSTSDKTADFTNSVDPDEEAHHEPPHQDLHCLNSHYKIAGENNYWNSADEIFVVCFLEVKELKHCDIKKNNNKKKNNY